MSAFINTRATLGDAETVAALIEHTLTELKEDGVTNLYNYALYKNTALTLVEFPNIARIRSNALDGCTGLGTVKLGGYDSSGVITLDASAFNGCSNLVHLLIDRAVKATLSNVSAFSGTKIQIGDGAVYVPQDLLSSYKSDNNWKNFVIFPLSAYPASSFDSIDDSWSTILSRADPSQFYSVGDTKSLTLTNDTVLKFQIAGFGLDTLYDDNTKKAKITWILKGIYTNHRMNATSTTSGGWADSELRSWLETDVLPLFPSDIRAEMKKVVKTYRSKSPNDETLSVGDILWIPSYKEVGFTNSTYVESDGVVYSGLFPNQNSRIKYNSSGSASYWWLRSAYSTTNFRGVNADGGGSYYIADYTLGVVLGFCTGEAVA